MNYIRYLKVIERNKTHFKDLSLQEIKENDQIIVLGKRSDGTVEAFSLRRIEDEFDIFKARPHRPMMPLPWER